MLSLQIRPVWNRKAKKAQEPEIKSVMTAAQYVAVAEEAAVRIGVKVVVGTILVAGATIALSTLSQIATTAFDNRNTDK